MAWTKEQKREARAEKRRTNAAHQVHDIHSARLDTLRHFVISKRTVSKQSLGQCDACDQSATITDGYMIICSACDKLLAAEGA